MDLNTYPERLTVSCELGTSYVCCNDNGSLETIIRKEFLNFYDVIFGETFMAEIDDRGKIIPTTIRKCSSKI
jgi:hypothetical protein